jgi:CubicO group peptidase (beta-lactamase class C family)
VGQAALEPAREPATEETAYDLASLTKSLATALLAVLMEQEGSLDLSAPVSALVPGMAGSPFAEASLLELGTHTARLPAWMPLYLGGGGREECIRRIARSEPAAEAGTALYSDLGYILLGFAVENAAEESLDRLFERRIAGPLGLAATGYAAGTDRFRNAAPTERGNLHERGMAGAAGEGHSWRTEIIRGRVHDGNAHALGGVAGHAGLFSTAAEVAAICREILMHGRLGLSHEARRRLLAPGSAGRTFGLTAAAESTAAGGVLPDDAVGHTGFTGTSLWLDPSGAGFYILLTNRVHPRVDPDLDFQTVRRQFHRLARTTGA